jgi:tRNA dimethylallyltransferase
MNKLPKIIVICGPTASGKTDLAISLAKKFHGEVICADSRTVYKGMDIGTAKPIRKGQKQHKDRYGFPYYTVKGIPHYTLDIVPPNKTYSVAEFKELSLAVIHSMLKRNKVPFIVGGTGLYIKALVDNLDFPQGNITSTTRKRLEKELRAHGLPFLVKKLFTLDPAARNFIDTKNPRRVLRALEVTIATKTPFSQQRAVGAPLFNTLQLGITVDKKTLKKRISLRIDKMLRSGFLDEVKKLKKIYGCSSPAMSGIGYRQMCRFYAKELSFEEATENFKKGDLHYAKRQMTWFKKDKRIKWITNNPRLPAGKASKAEVVAKKFLKTTGRV